ncbi:unnamed protein product [Rotaria sp. Silwood1]|nr:unnamed protein product [Rotaria sp. Silwood1]CAF1363455.1 unnamed protein product [Rotaria sp. Silwood1]CAF3555836.1 unnamed protein product [Rotaria sp. Silwood1]CAF4563851.1 unnamed protein product [Rotaria sp. Silwood1]CAF4758853.1 unnamed protein product [Rotaria sp. Silwood1]
MITTSTNNYTFTNTAENLIHVEDIQHIDLSYIEEHEDLPEKSADLRPINKEQNHLAIFTLKHHNCSLPSSPIDPPLVIHTSPPEEQDVTASSSPLLKENTVCTVNIKHEVSSKSTNRSSIISKRKISAIRKRSVSPAEPIALRLSVHGLKRLINCE